MKCTISIPKAINISLYKHLFKNELEQGAFLFAEPDKTHDTLNIMVKDYYLVQKEGWQVQHEVYLEMKDTERAKIMHIACLSGYSIIDCHSHPKSESMVAFSPSDINGITAFSEYAKWKLNGKPFCALVWGESSVDAVIWDDFKNAKRVNSIEVIGKTREIQIPRCSWFVYPNKKWF